jgi:hypothetical protein
LICPKSNTVHAKLKGQSRRQTFLQTTNSFCLNDRSDGLENVLVGLLASIFVQLKVFDAFALDKFSLKLLTGFDNVEGIREET